MTPKLYKILVWSITLFGAAILHLGILTDFDLNLTAELSMNVFERTFIERLNPNLTAAHATTLVLYLLGGVILIIPAILKARYANGGNFAKLLIVLQSFLGVSAVFGILNLGAFLKFALRISTSYGALSWLKRINLLPDFKVWQIFSVPFHIAAIRGQLPPEFLGALGLELLGLGYALAAKPLAMYILLTWGSTYLTVFAWRGWKDSRDHLLLCWVEINLAYTCSGVWHLQELATRSLK
jgi:hypothetical protein